jgi:hypothetical protein
MLLACAMLFVQQLANSQFINEFFLFASMVQPWWLLESLLWPLGYFIIYWKKKIKRKLVLILQKRANSHLKKLIMVQE